jgi:protein Xni
MAMKALLVDGLNLVRRIHAAVPAPDPQADTLHDDARMQRVITSCVSSLERALRFHRPSHALVVFESDAPTWRHRLFPDYKKNRPAMPEDLRDGLPDIQRAFLAIGVRSFERPGYEADDVIGTIATKIEKSGGKSTILSTDRHYCQLLGPCISVHDHFGQQSLDRDMIRQRFDVEPGDLPYFFALTGDPGKSIPGIHGVGIRTAARLIADYPDLESLLEASLEMTGKIGSKILSGADDARTGLALFRLRTDIELGINLNQLRYQPAQ